jgi:hypothetical protein
MTEKTPKELQTRDRNKEVYRRLALLLRQENVVTLEEIYETLKEETKEAISDALHRLVTNGTLKKRTLSDGNVLIEVYWTSLTEVWNLSKQPYWEHWKLQQELKNELQQRLNGRKYCIVGKKHQFYDTLQNFFLHLG